VLFIATERRQVEPIPVGEYVPTLSAFLFGATDHARRNAAPDERLGAAFPADPQWWVVPAVGITKSA